MNINFNKMIVLGATASVFLGMGAAVVGAATNYDSKLTQSITGSVLSTDIRDNSNQVVALPSFAMSAVSASTSQQTATGTFGSASQRISVDDARGNGSSWTLALNAKTPGTGTWTSGGNTYKYNDTAANGQLTVNPTAGTITAVTGGATGVTKGTSATFSGTGAITLMSADATASKIWNGYITGIGLSQTIPAGQAVGNYTIDMTQTVTGT